jgi:hypothetical protein
MFNALATILSREDEPTAVVAINRKIIASKSMLRCATQKEKRRGK